ncbi:hypothetical protein CC85DRAFT_325756 [Cutaneotrichosporon oleaginosum]|uniref:Uncharacterized protein n=1 Tax=Cutaneotrichosporon oleaginosum TaxID=879819 RepID=A0A0J1BB69_9TREE|nr:uncharacterized protein CC85DRAFT_325756 [Cutaneotrichosporon oleaginosum]KLT45234.1 hypothetical protein CC85DRAFT_325756 [Cutaneotrichosporon oleaginosum]TXT14933.1 hypothetical protein COLE_01126 [Cutaneotrichosporon oleaginosum]
MANTESQSSSAAKSAWAIPAALKDLIALDASARTAVIDKMLQTTHPGLPATAAPPTPVPSAPFLDALKRVPDTITWNGAAAFKSTNSALLDLFDGLQAGVKAEDVFKMLQKAWKEDPDKTLRIILQARSIHEGKGLKIAFFHCVAWLWDNHPRTLLANLRQIVEPTCERARSQKKDAAKAERNNNVVALDENGEPEKEPEYPPRPHGSFDDLNDILVLAINGQLTTTYIGKLTAIDEALAPSSSASYFKASRVGDTAEGKSGRQGYSNAAREARKSEQIARKVVAKAQTETGVNLDKKRKAEEDRGATLRLKLARCGTKQMRNAAISAHTEKGLTDPKVQILLAEVVNIYAEFLKADLERLKAHEAYLERPAAERQADGYGAPGSSPHLFGMSYAAKWAPTPGKSADKQLHMATALAFKMFPADDMRRRKLQDEVLSPLRRVLNVPERSMVKGKWKIDYTKVPARCMARNENNFLEHDPVGFEAYLLAVASGKKTIAGASMIPHELLLKALSTSSIISRVANLQWTALVDSIRSNAKGELTNCIAVADVSGSMGSIYYPSSGGGRVEAIWPCIALTLLMTELARPPWNGAFITFSSDPEIQRVDNDLSVAERARNLSKADWGMSTDYRKVFESILRVAKEAKLAPGDMVKTVFVFSDMQFDQSGRFGATEHQVVTRRFQQAGYPMPELVYWNLQSAAAKPVQADTPGCALVSGFSGALMKYFIRALGDDGDDEDKEPKEDEDWDDLKDLDIKDEDDGDDEDEEDDAETLVKGDAKEKAAKAKKTPMDHLNAIIAARPFCGVVVVD